MEDLISKIAHRALQARKDHRLSRPKFAAKLNMPPTTIKNYEMCYRTMSLEYILKFREVFGEEWFNWVTYATNDKPAVNDTI